MRQQKKREELRRSLRTPHPESSEVTAEGLAGWADALPDEEVADLVDLGAGREVRWIPGAGWTSEE